MNSKRWIALLLVLALALGSVSFAVAEDAGAEVEDVSLEEEEIIDENSEEARADASEQEALMSSEQTEEEEGSEAAPEETAEAESDGAPQKAEDLAVAHTPCNIREERDLKSKMLKHLDKGDKVTVTAYYDDGWCVVPVGDRDGYCRISWFDFPGKAPEEIPKDKTPSVNDQTGEPVWDTDGRGFTTPKATEDPVVPDATSLDPREAPPSPEGIYLEGTEPDTSDGEEQYIAMTKGACKIWDQPSAEKGRRIGEVKKGQKLHVLAYGDDWCRVTTWNGQCTGYVMSKFVFHYHSKDPFKYEIPWYKTYKMTGYISVTKPIRITDRRDLYKGQQLQVGDVVCCQLRDDGDYDILLRRDWVTVPKEYGEYHAFVNWSEAKAGDCLGGFTLFYGIGQGGKMHRGRAGNIVIAMKRMDGVIVEPGQKYSFLKNIGPVTLNQGYKVAGVIGGNGRGVGGGICHTSSLTYSAILSLPMFIYEREPHTDEGVFYIPLEFDATVGGWSDFIYYNTLPYAIKHHAFYNKYNGNITMYFECVETKTEEEIQNWDWTKLPLPKCKEEGG